MTAERLRVAVVGCGDIAAIHLDAILDAAAAGGVEPVGVCDVDEGRRAEAATRAGCPGFADLTDMLDAVAPDVVHVCTPHDRHADLAAECLARDVSVLLEKPVARTLDDGERLAVVAEDSAALLGVCFQNRYNDTSRMLREILDRGGLGRIVGARASVTVEIVTEHARLRLDTDLTVAHDDGRVETFHPATAVVGENGATGVRRTGADRRLLPAPSAAGKRTSGSTRPPPSRPSGRSRPRTTGRPRAWAF